MSCKKIQMSNAPKAWVETKQKHGRLHAHKHTRSHLHTDTYICAHTQVSVSEAGSGILEQEEY